MQGRSVMYSKVSERISQRRNIIVQIKIIENMKKQNYYHYPWRDKKNLSMTQKKKGALEVKFMMTKMKVKKFPKMWQQKRYKFKRTNPESSTFK